jgi:hypothetical protein
MSSRIRDFASLGEAVKPKLQGSGAIANYGHIAMPGRHYNHPFPSTVRTRVFRARKRVAALTGSYREPITRPRFPARSKPKPTFRRAIRWMARLNLNTDQTHIIRCETFFTTV